MSGFRNSMSLLSEQVISLMIQNRPFDAQLASATTVMDLLTVQLVSNVLRSVPRFFFHSPRAIGCQNTTRRRSYPPREKKIDPQRVSLGVNKSVQFFLWLEDYSNFVHTDITCREMACVFARGNELGMLWKFLLEYSKREDGSLVTCATVTCLIKVLGQEGLVNASLALFYRMNKFHCKPDVYAYNAIILALCRIGNFKKARFLLEQMELPGFKCIPDTYTYTILISCYCKYGLQTGCRKATRRRLWDANHLFRIMLTKGFVPDVVTYNCLIDACCRTYRIGRALELLDDMIRRGCFPNRITYNSFIRYFSLVNQIDKAIEMLRRMQYMYNGLIASSSYTPIIHGLVEAGRILEARDFLAELVDGGSIPREYTYNMVSDALFLVGQGDLIDDALHKRIKEGIEGRYLEVKKVKPVIARQMRTR